MFGSRMDRGGRRQDIASSREPASIGSVTTRWHLTIKIEPESDGFELLPTNDAGNSSSCCRVIQEVDFGCPLPPTVHGLLSAAQSLAPIRWRSSISLVSLSCLLLVPSL
jgi:hypothetical protein